MKRLAAICICVSLLAFAAPPAVRAQAQNASAQSSGALSGGGTYVLHADSALPTAAIELWYRAPSAGYDASTPGIAHLALAALAASAAPHETSLAQTVAGLGGSLSINVYPDIAMVGISVPGSHAAAMMKALTKAYFAPEISADGYKLAVRDGAIGAAELQFDPDRLLQDALFERMFSSGPAHYPPSPLSAQALASISQDAVKAFAQRAFRRENAFLTIAGDVTPALLSDVYAGTSAGAPGPDSPLDSVLSDVTIDATQGAQVGGLGIAWTGPPIGDPKAATAMDFLADYLFDQEHGTVASALREKDSDTLVNGQFITLHDPGVLLVTVSGAHPDAAQSPVLDAVAAMQSPLDAKTFEAARAAFEYHIAAQMQTPASRADNFGWYAAEGNAPYAPGDASGEYFKALESLDPGYVAGVARKYLTHPAVVKLLAAPHAAGTALQ